MYEASVRRVVVLSVERVAVLLERGVLDTVGRLAYGVDRSV